ncbi:MAG TPA: CDP-alcohol phosphatidyltransferase family protein [Kofleriaceae bacterium]|nr:CDP-alcohol phosphatidyltransferase family protein [Kofleriaceae bacterium]
MRTGPNEGWILAREDMRPSLREDVCGMPYVLRIAADLAHAGAKKIFVIWRGTGTAAAGAPPPTVADLATDSRLKGAELTVVTSPPVGVTDDPILVARADRIYHRDTPKLGVRAWREGSAPLAKVAGDEYDAVVVTTRDGARRLLDAWSVTGSEVATAEPPYLGFTVAAPDARSLRRAEKLLVWSLRKQAQGIAAYWINRHISLPVTRAICRTNIIPNQVTVFCFLLALTGGIVIGQGGYLAGVLGMALVNLGSILDGVDGELARLKYRFSHIGAWLDTLADDFGNVAYISGIAVNLHKAGSPSWAVPLAVTALVCFALTQSTQYFLITKVYRSGDLAAIPWAFQSNEFLTAKPKNFIEWLKNTIPKTLKRDFALTMFVVFALVGHLEWILVVFSAGAIIFFVVFVIQLLRNLDSVRNARRVTNHN